MHGPVTMKGFKRTINFEEATDDVLPQLLQCCSGASLPSVAAATAQEAIQEGLLDDGHGLGARKWTELMAQGRALQAALALGDLPVALSTMGIQAAVPLEGPQRALKRTMLDFHPDKTFPNIGVLHFNTFLVPGLLL